MAKTVLDRIYGDEKRLKDFHLGLRRGFEAAARFVDEHRASANGYRLGDLILCKFNQTTRKPRKAKKETL